MANDEEAVARAESKPNNGRCKSTSTCQELTILDWTTIVRELKLIDFSQIRAFTASADIRPECSQHMAQRPNVLGSMHAGRKGDSLAFFKETNLVHLTMLITEWMESVG